MEAVEVAEADRRQEVDMKAVGCKWAVQAVRRIRDKN